MVPNCTNNSRKTAGIGYHRVPAEKRLRQAWVARIRRVNPCSPNNSFVCSEHFTRDCFEENLPGLAPFYQNKLKPKANSVSSIFPQRSTGNPRSTDQRRNLVRARRDVLFLSGKINAYILIDSYINSFSGYVNVQTRK